MDSETAAQIAEMMRQGLRESHRIRSLQNTKQLNPTISIKATPDQNEEYVEKVADAALKQATSGELSKLENEKMEALIFKFIDISNTVNDPIAEMRLKMLLPEIADLVNGRKADKEKVQGMVGTILRMKIKHEMILRGSSFRHRYI